jgi:hypothetical protein
VVAQVVFCEAAVVVLAELLTETCLFLLTEILLLAEQASDLQMLSEQMALLAVVLVAQEQLQPLVVALVMAHRTLLTKTAVQVVVVAVLGVILVAAQHLRGKDLMVVLVHPMAVVVAAVVLALLVLVALVLKVATVATV